MRLVGIGGAALVIALLCEVPVAGAEVYRWTDADGRVHFTDRKPEEARANEVKAIALPADAVQQDPALQQQRERGRKLLEVWDTEREQRARNDAAAAAQQEQQRRECARVEHELAACRT